MHRGHRRFVQVDQPFLSRSPLKPFRQPRHLAFGHDLQRGLLRWVQIALKPAAKGLGMHWIFMRCEDRKFVIADSASKHVQVHAWAFWLDADEHHLGLAARAGGAQKWSRWNGSRQSGGPPLFELSFEVRRDRAHDPNSGVRGPTPVLSPQRSRRPKGPKQHQREPCPPAEAMSQVCPVHRARPKGRLAPKESNTTGLDRLGRKVKQPPRLVWVPPCRKA